MWSIVPFIRFFVCVLEAHAHHECVRSQARSIENVLGCLIRALRATEDVGFEGLCGVRLAP
jgi:hypothetical protein